MRASRRRGRAALVLVILAAVSAGGAPEARAGRGDEVAAALRTYEILEVVPAAADIMGAPGWGRVRRRHFERLIERATPRS